MCDLVEKPAGVKLRSALPEDEAFLFAVYAGTRSDELALTNWGRAEKHSFLRLQFEARRRSYLLQTPGAEYAVIQWDGTDAGTMIIDRRDTEIGLVDLALLPEFRSRKIGSSLMANLLEEARLNGKPVRLHVERFNPALQWYHRLGFRIVGEDPIYLEMVWTPLSLETHAQMRCTA